MKCNKDEPKVLYLGRAKPHVSTDWAAISWGPALHIRTPLNSASHCDLVGMKAEHVLSCISRSISSRLEKVAIPPYSGLVKVHLPLIRSKEKVLLLWVLSAGTSGISIPRDTQNITGKEQPDLTSKRALLWAESWNTGPQEVTSSLNFSPNSMIYDSSWPIFCHYVVEKMACTFTRGMFQAVSVLPIKTLATAYVNIFKMFFNVILFIIFPVFKKKILLVNMNFLKWFHKNAGKNLWKYIAK